MCRCFSKYRNLEKHKDFWRRSNHLRRGRLSVWFSMQSGGCLSERTGTLVSGLSSFLWWIRIFLLFLTTASSSGRFAVALEQFSDSLQMVKNRITPGKLTWPLTKETVKETQPDYFKVCCWFRLFYIWQTILKHLKHIHYNII